MEQDRKAGCLFGMALGDALGAETEFLDIFSILQRFPPHGIQSPQGNPARVTDDTQMALAVGDALIAAPRPYMPDSLSREFVRTFTDWYNDPDNDRAPGNTCLTACEELLSGKAWYEAAQINSKGCGANMRVMPIGLIDVDEATRAGMAQLQAAITHGHPTGLAAADLTAYVIADLGNDGSIDGLLKRVQTYAETQRGIYHQTWLGDLWERSIMFRSPDTYIARGWDECLGVLDRVDAVLVQPDRETDPCQQTGAGWIAEEAFATALLCFLLYPDDATAVIRRAALTSGDSDSIAAIAGAFAGAYHGSDAWEHEWIERIEYHDRLAQQSAAL